MERNLPTLGCLLLGGSGAFGNVDDTNVSKKTTPVYVTRHRIDSYTQSKPLCRDVACETFLPCVKRGHDGMMCLWHAFRSELMLFSLHMSTLAFGVLKEALDLRHIDEEDMHESHSYIELIITLLIIALRMINTRMGYVEVQINVQRLQHFDPVHEPHLRAVWTWMWLMLFIGAINFIVAIVCFVVFSLTSHLGWTLLSNQGCILTMRVLAGLYESRTNTAIAKIKEDQHKVVIHESVMMLQEVCSSSSTAADSSGPVQYVPASVITTIREFIGAVFHTKALNKPPYIVLTNRRQQPQESGV